MATPLALVWDLIARDSGASATFDRVAVSADRAAASTAKAETGIAGFGKKAGAALAALATVDFAVHIVKDAAQFQKSMLLIQTQAGASAATVKQFSGEILKMAGPLGTAPEALANSLYHVVSASQGLLTSAQQLKIMQVAAEGAKVGNANLEETTNALTAAVASGIPGVQSYAQAMGSLNAIVGSGDMKLSDLNAAMSSGILANMRNFGLSLNDVGSALAVFGDNNIRGADAATMLRTAVSAMAQPVKTGAATLKALNISSTELGADMNKGGLNSALTDLVAHLEAAGKTKSIADLSQQVKGMKGNIDLAAVSSSSLGQLLTEAFGKKTGPGLAVLVSQLDRFRTKEDEIAAGAHNFDSAWAATQKTASFAFDRLRAGLDSLAISLGTKLLPGVTSAADWLGTTLPADLGKLQSALAPVEHIVGETLVLAWRALAASLSVAGSALSGIVNVIGGHTGVLNDMATATLALWAAFKGVSLAVVGLKALDGALLAAHTRMLAFADSFAAVAAGEKVMSMGAFIGILGAIGVAAYAAGKGMSSIIESNNSFAHVMDNSANSAKSFTQALDDSNGALTASVAKTVAAQLQSVGLADKAHAAGISLNQLTGAVTGTNAQYAALVETWRKSGDVSGDTITALGLMHAQYGQAASGAKDLATVTGQSTTALAKQAKVALAAATASQNLAQAVKPLASAYDSATQTGKDFLDTVTAFSKSAGTAADQASLIGATLKANAGDALNFAAQMNAAATASKQLSTDITSAAKGIGKGGESTKTFLDSIINLKKNSIDYGKTAAAPLISNLQSIQTAAINAAEATFQHNKGLEGGKQAADDAIKGYKGVETSLDGQLTKLGLTSGQAQKLTDKYLGVPSKVKTLIEQEGADPVINVLNKIGQQLSYLTGHKWTSALDGNTNPLVTKIKAAQDYLDRLKQNRVPGIQVGTAEYYRQVAAAQARLNALKGKNVPISATDHASATLIAIKAHLDSIQGKTVVINTAYKVSGGGINVQGGAGVQGRASGGGAPEGWFAVGEQGAELVHKSGSAVQIFSNAMSRSILAATGMKAPGFAAGTTHTKKKAPVHITLPDGTVVSSQQAASNALTRAFNSLAAAVPKFTASLTKTTDQMKTAEAALLKDVKASGESKSVLNSITKDFAKLNSLATKRDALQAQLGTPDKAATQTAYEKLTDALSTYTGEISTVAQAITSGFNITTAGVPAAATSSGPSFAYQQALARYQSGMQMPGDADLLGAGDGSDSTTSSAVSVSQIISTLKGQIGDATKFRTELAKITKEGLATSLVQQLGEGGVSGSGATVDALATQATAAQIRQITKLSGDLNTVATATGTDVANTVAGQQLKVMQNGVRQLDARLQSVEKAIHGVGSDVAKALNGATSTASSKARGSR